MFHHLKVLPLHFHLHFVIYPMYLSLLQIQHSNLYLLMMVLLFAIILFLKLLMIQFYFFSYKTNAPILIYFYVYIISYIKNFVNSIFSHKKNSPRFSFTETIFFLIITFLLLFGYNFLYFKNIIFLF